MDSFGGVWQRLNHWVKSALSKPRNDFPMLKAVLRAWAIDIVDFQNLRGSSGSVWLIKALNGRFVLKRVPGSGEYLAYQLSVVRHLRDVKFPYLVPEFLPPLQAPSQTNFDWDDDGSNCWVLYRFIEDSKDSSLPVPEWAKEMGKVVASFGLSLRTYPIDRPDNFSIDLFDRDYVTSTIANKENWTSAAPDRWAMQGLMHSRSHNLVEELLTIPQDDIDEIRSLTLTTVYYDWHSHNLLQRAGHICGLINFDSLIQAPRIVDLQNGLNYVLLLNQPRDLLLPYCEAYGSVYPRLRSRWSIPRRSSRTPYVSSAF